MQFLSNFIADSWKIYRLWNSNKFFHQLLKVLYHFIPLNAIGTYVFNCKLFRFAVQRNEIYCSFLHYRLSANFMSFGKTIGIWKKDSVFLQNSLTWILSETSSSGSLLEYARSLRKRKLLRSFLGKSLRRL